jgi:hypothetical protein
MQHYSPLTAYAHGAKPTAQRQKHHARLSTALEYAFGLITLVGGFATIYALAAIATILASG